jgi:thioredoxin:protein disulfide reductase
LKIRTVSLLILVLFATACSRAGGNNATSPTPSSLDVVKANPEEVTISPGGTAAVQVRLKIDSGYHINANPPSFPYLKPTELELTPDGGLSVSFTRYPDPLLKKFSFSESPLAVYEGDTTVSVQLKAARSAALGRKNLSGKLRVQACDDQVCYAPATMDIVVPVNVQ